MTFLSLTHKEFKITIVNKKATNGTVPHNVDRRTYPLVSLANADDVPNFCAN